jgi:uncharacterized membrane protein YccC
MRRAYDAAVHRLLAMPAATPSPRLLADQTARVLAGLSDVLGGLALLADGRAPRVNRDRRVSHHVPDWLPALVNALRAFVTIGAVELFWIITQWPNGALAITWAAIVVILFSPRADAAYAQAASFMTGTMLAAIFAAIILFAALPKVETFAGLGLIIGLYLVPVGALMAQPWQAAMFAPMAGNFVPLLGPANQMSYDTVHFYNTALAVVAGCGAAMLSLRLLPPLSPAFRTYRLLRLTLRDLRRLATGAAERLADDWQGRMYARVSALPDEAAPLHRAQLVAGLSVGTEIIHLRRTMRELGLGRELDSALEAFAGGNSATAIARLAAVDRRLSDLPDAEPQSVLVMRERGGVLGICDALVRHRSYFEGELG